MASLVTVRHTVTGTSSLVTVPLAAQSVKPAWQMFSQDKLVKDSLHDFLIPSAPTVSWDHRARKPTRLSDQNTPLVTPARLSIRTTLQQIGAV
jgi:hypothetical protein